MIIAVDFDGTIAKTEFPAIKSVMPKAREAMELLRQKGHYLIVWTCRLDRDLLDAINWMVENHIPFDRVNDECPVQTAKFGRREHGKVFADVYIDDRNVGGFPGWEAVLKMISKLELSEAMKQSISVPFN